MKRVLWMTLAALLAACGGVDDILGAGGGAGTTGNCLQCVWGPDCVSANCVQTASGKSYCAPRNMTTGTNLCGACPTIPECPR